MACRLYRHGDTYEVRGVTCEAQIFEAHEVHVQLENGWFAKPGGWLEDGFQEEEIKKENTEDHEEVTETSKEKILNYDSMETPELRIIAKGAYIDNWKTARRLTLLKKLKEV